MDKLKPASGSGSSDKLDLAESSGPVKTTESSEKLDLSGSYEPVKADELHLAGSSGPVKATESSDEHDLCASKSKTGEMRKRKPYDPEEQHLLKLHNKEMKRQQKEAECEAATEFFKDMEDPEAGAELAITGPGSSNQML